MRRTTFVLGLAAVTAALAAGCASTEPLPAPMTASAPRSVQLAGGDSVGRMLARHSQPLALGALNHETTTLATVPDQDLSDPAQ